MRTVTRPPPARARTGLIAAALLGAFALLFVGQRVPDRPEAVGTTAGPGAAAARPADACALSLACASEAALAAADPACRQAIAQLAAYGMRWTAPDAAHRFTGRAWLDRLAGTIQYGGDKAEFEDGAGRLRSVRYECDFDPVQRAVLEARAQPG